jgi:hypothetical protein
MHSTEIGARITFRMNAHTHARRRKWRCTSVECLCLMTPRGGGSGDAGSVECCDLNDLLPRPRPRCHRPRRAGRGAPSRRACATPGGRALLLVPVWFDWYRLYIHRSRICSRMRLRSANLTACLCLTPHSLPQACDTPLPHIHGISLSVPANQADTNTYFTTVPKEHCQLINCILRAMQHSHI